MPGQTDDDDPLDSHQFVEAHNFRRLGTTEEGRRGVHRVHTNTADAYLTSNKSRDRPSSADQLAGCSLSSALVTPPMLTQSRSGTPLLQPKSPRRLRTS